MMTAKRKGPEKTKESTAKKAKGATSQTLPLTVVTPTAATDAGQPPVEPAPQDQTVADQQAEPEIQTELVPRQYERMALTIDPNFVDSLVKLGRLGYLRPHAQRHAVPRHYVVEVTNFRNAITALIRPYLEQKLWATITMTEDEITAELNTVVPLITNACMAALYAKLRNIHRSYQQYSGRFPNPPTYTKDVELPLPLANAIETFGLFVPASCLTHNTVIPVYPENIQNEGRSTQNWSCHQYEAYVPYLKELGIPVKSIDTRVKTGTPWWTYKVERQDDCFDFRCIFPPVNYSDHSVLIATMFARTNDAGESLPIIQALNDDRNYAYRGREIPDDFKLKAFAALCHASSEEWNQYLPITA